MIKRLGSAFLLAFWDEPGGVIAAIIGILALAGLAGLVLRQVVDTFRYEGVGSAIGLMLLFGAVVVVALWGVW